MGMMTVNGVEYTVHKLLGKGKGGYSYLVTKGLRALYFKYLYLLGAVPKRRPKKRAAFVSRAEIIKFDRYQEQFQYLMKNRIETADQLSMQYDALQASIDALTDQRRELYGCKR